MSSYDGGDWGLGPSLVTLSPCHRVIPFPAFHSRERDDPTLDRHGASPDLARRAKGHGTAAGKHLHVLSLH